MLDVLGLRTEAGVLLQSSVGQIGVSGPDPSKDFSKGRLQLSTAGAAARIVFIRTAYSTSANSYVVVANTQLQPISTYRGC